jgi:hypothetical protein
MQDPRCQGHSIFALKAAIFKKSKETGGCLKRETLQYNYIV